MTINLLSKIPLFADLPLDELNRLITALDVKELKPGEILFHEGDPGDHLYIVMKGELDVLMGAGKPDELILNVLREGEYLGEMSLITPGGHRAASVRACGDAVLLSLSRAQFVDMTKRYPELSISMVRVLSQRLDSTNTQAFRDLTEKNLQLQTAYDELQSAQAQLIEKERIEQELQVAADIQLSILPDELPKVDGYNFGARIQPARQVGGDFYDVFEMDDNQVGVLIGDVADKGVPSAIFMARTHALIMAEADIGLTPGEVMKLVNRHITRLQRSTQFVTVLYGILNRQTHEFTYARAGHEPPLVLYASGKVERIPHSPGMAIGLWDEITLDERVITLPPGSTLLLYTDGMTDCREPNGEAFGLERIKLTLSRFTHLTAQQICDELLDTLKGYENDAKQDDDVTLVAVKVE